MATRYKVFTKIKTGSIENPAPHNGLIAWLETRPDEDGDDSDDDEPS